MHIFSADNTFFSVGMWAMGKLVVFTDLDATLLDPDDYSWTAATEALATLKRVNAILSLVSSKTFAEMAPIHKALGIEDPFVTENGGSVVAREGSALADELRRDEEFPKAVREGKWLIFPQGTAYKDLVTALSEIAEVLGCPLVGFNALSVREVARLTGLSEEEAQKAKDRQFDEPFLVTDDAWEREDQIREAAAARGLAVVAGGRFWHLMGHGGKGSAVSRLIRASRRVFGEIVTVGLGDSPNDYPFLEIVDIPVVLRGAHKAASLPPSLARGLFTKQSGPVGWNEAILRIVSGLDSE
ncbi:MAG: HAD-IIB family hydrolase [Deltaproteobacteria bacterium]|nr:HAD-IIB family hydrolase [Deltaproteobacteria bacterium]